MPLEEALLDFGSEFQEAVEQARGEFLQAARNAGVVGGIMIGSVEVVKQWFGTPESRGEVRPGATVAKALTREELAELHHLRRVQGPLPGPREPAPEPQTVGGGMPGVSMPLLITLDVARNMFRVTEKSDVMLIKHRYLELAHAAQNPRELQVIESAYELLMQEAIRRRSASSRPS